MRRILSYVPGWALVAIVALLALSAAVVIAAPGVAPFRQGGGIGYDPLTGDEAQRALDAVQAGFGVQSAAVRTAPVAAAGQPAILASAEEVVLVERHPEEKAIMAAGTWDRRADVFVYRYADDTLVHGLYNYATGETTIVEEVQGVQLPLTAAERDLAGRIAFADPATLEFLRSEYRRITGRELTAPEQVDMRAFVYHAGANPETEPPEAARCGVQRCAQLMILADDDITFDAMPVVNLSTLTVASLTPLAVDGAAVAPGASATAGHDHTGGGNE